MLGGKVKSLQFVVVVVVVVLIVNEEKRKLSGVITLRYMCRSSRFVFLLLDKVSK